jgi:hypothetical protein
MRTLLRDKTTNLYFQGPDRWTKNPAGAFDFRFMERAIHYCEMWRLTGVELAFAYEGPQEVLTVPLEAAALRCATA